MREKSSTRARIQEIALRLFTEQGYEATSLREIAEELGVTKAALYYHFKTKEDIVISVAEQVAEALDEILEWGHTQPRTSAFRAELLRRYAEGVQARHIATLRFMQRNQTVMREHPVMDGLKKKMFDLVDLIADSEATSAERLRAALALFAVHASWFLLKDDPMGDEERLRVGLEVALDMVGVTDDQPQGG